MIESPEPLAFTREVSVSLTQHLPSAPWQPIGPAQLQTALAQLHFSTNQVTVALPFAVFAPGDLIVVIIRSHSGTAFAIYTAPQRSGLLSIPGAFQGTISPPRGARPDLDQLRDFPNNAITLIRKKILIAAIAPGAATGPIDKLIPLAVLDNGSETAALLLPTSATAVLAPLAPGNYTLAFAIDRKRWRDNASTDPEARYSQPQSIDLNW